MVLIGFFICEIGCNSLFCFVRFLCFELNYVVFYDYIEMIVFMNISCVM